MKALCSSAIAVLLCLASTAYPQQVTITGYVTAAGGAPIRDATVWLMMNDKLTTTDSAGYYSLSGPTRAVAAPSAAPRECDARVVHGYVVLEIGRPQNVSVALFDASGRQVCDVVRAGFGAGEHRIALGDRVRAAGILFVRVRTADGETVLRLTEATRGSVGASSPAGVVQSRPLAKQMTTGIDTLIFTALGYRQLILPIDTLEGVFDASLPTASLTPAVAGMRQLVGDTFTMGGPLAAASATPVHKVTVTGFYIDTTEVTQTRYLAVMGVVPSVALGFSYDHLLPVESVTWFDAALFCNRQSRIDGRDTVYSYTGLTGTPGYGCTAMAGLAIDLTKNGYRLPTEAQWEYACRAGTTSGYYWGAGDSAAAYAWYADNSNAMSHPVAGRRPNSFGLYDMSGNVWEWTDDWYGYYTAAAQIDPTGPAHAGSQATRVVRGGSQDNDTTNITSYMRQIWFQPSTRYMTIGFRTVRPLN